MVCHGQGRFSRRDVPGHGRDAQEARVRGGLQGDGRGPHVDQLAQLSERIRAAAFPVGTIDRVKEEL